MKFETKTKIEDHLGKEIFYLTPISESSELAKDGSKQWNFRCVCGKIITDTPYRVMSGHKKSCGCMRYKNIKRKTGKRPAARVDAVSMIGRSKNRLTVIGYEREMEKGRVKLKCRCDCGNIVFVLPYQFENGAVQSCGCIRGEKRKTHGLSKNPLYGEWFQMVNRCHNPNADNYERYGGRGITVCDEWRDSPVEFIKWVEENGGKPDGMTLDRIDNDGPYAPWNCQWSTASAQQRNRRANIFLCYKGENKCLADWAKETGISHETLRGRYKAGWSVEEIIETPVGSKNENWFKPKDKAAP